MNPFRILPTLPEAGRSVGDGRCRGQRLKALLPALALLIAAGCDFSPINNVGTEVEGLTGTLVTESGRPASGAWVRVHPVSPTMLARAAASSLTTAATDSVRTGATGTFQFKDLPEGLYNLSASVRRGDTTLALFVASLSIVGDTNIGTDTLYRSGTIILQARGTGGAPVPGAVCAIGDSPWQTVSDGTGLCILQDVAPGVFRVTVTHPSYLKTLTTDITIVRGDSVGAPAIDLVDTNSVILPPGVPALVSPVGNALVAASSTLNWTGDGSWTGSRYIERQIIEVALDSLFQNIVVRDTMILNATVSTGGMLGRGNLPLADGTTYWWRVTLQNNSGSARSLSARFRTTNGLVTPAGPRLVAHWDFNEGTGTTLTDRTGRGHNGTIQSATWADGIQGKALSFNGMSSQVVVPFNAELNLKSFTISTWIKTSKVGSQAIVSRQMSSGQSQPWNYRITVTEAGSYPTVTIPAGHILADFWPQQVTGPISTVPVANGVWHNVTTVMRDSTMLLYVDGVLSASVNMRMFPDTSTTEPLRIGASAFANNRSWFEGLIDEVRLYDGPLTAAQVDSLYRAFAPVVMSEIAIPASQDAGILAPAPTQATPVGTHGNSNFGKLPDFAVGAYDVNTVARALVRFTIPQGVSGSRITKAVIRLNSREWITKNVRRDTIRLEAHRVLRDWKEGTGTNTNGTLNDVAVDGVTGLERFWGTQNGSEDWSQKLMGLNNIDANAVAEASASRPGAYIGTWEFDVTALARVWADNPSSNFGVVFATEIPATNEVVWDYPVFHSREASAVDTLKPRLILSLKE